MVLYQINVMMHLYALYYAYGKVVKAARIAVVCIKLLHTLPLTSHAKYQGKFWQEALVHSLP